jgi:transcription-repair coupling factor (superfamily II helicase)
LRKKVANKEEYFRNLKKAQLEQDAKRGFIFAITGEDPPEVNEAEIQKEEEFNAIEKANLKALKRDIENMQVKAVEIAKSNSKSESTFQLIGTHGLHYSPCSKSAHQFAPLTVCVLTYRTSSPHTPNDRSPDPP